MKRLTAVTAAIMCAASAHASGYDNAVVNVREWAALETPFDSLPDCVTGAQLNRILKLRFGPAYRYLSATDAERAAMCERGDKTACDYSRAVVNFYRR